MRNLILILLLSGLYSIVSAQDMGNRKKIINMVLGQSHTKANAEQYNHAMSIYAIMPTAQSTPQGFRSSGTIPRYCLAKGAVICRFEEYVQLHSPFKLNIGVGGE
jgi:hypothetical protein